MCVCGGVTRSVMSPIVRTHMESGYNRETGLEVQTYFEQFFLGGGKFGLVSNHEHESIISKRYFQCYYKNR